MSKTTQGRIRFQSPGKSGYVGVYQDKASSLWVPRVHHAGIRHHLGRFKDKTEAAIAHDKLARELKGESAITNGFA